MKFSYSDIKSYCDELHSIAKSIKSSTEKIETACNSLSKNSDWEGSSADNYSSKLKNLTNNFDDIYKRKEQMRVY